MHGYLSVCTDFCHNLNVLASESCELGSYQSPLLICYTHPVNYVYQKLLLNENESYLVLVAGHVLLVTINNDIDIRHVTMFRLASITRELIIG